jgi:hypothetical protein
VAICEPLIHHTLRNKGRLTYAQIRRPKHGANHALSGYGILSDEFAISRQHAAKVLRPRAIEGAIDDDVTDVLGTQTLWFWRKSEKSVDLALSKQLDRFDPLARYPLDILSRIEPNKRRHRADENVRTTPDPLMADGSTPQIGNAAYTLSGE